MTEHGQNRDLIDHDLTSLDCICGPSVKVIKGIEVVIHHTLDGRPDPEVHESEIKPQDEP